MTNKKYLYIVELIAIGMFLSSCAEQTWNKSGLSQYTYKGGQQYTGTFDENGFLNGQGTAVYENGDKYSGEFKFTMREGQGTYTFKNGNKYTGQWLHGKFDGHGILEFSGNKYEGRFRNGTYDGKGTLTLANGKIYLGEWANGRLIPTTAPASSFPGITADKIVTGVISALAVKTLLMLLF